MAVLRSEEEVELCHYHFDTPRYSYMFFGFWTVFFFIILFMAEYNPYTNTEIPWDNCDLNKTWEPTMRSFINKEQYKSEQKKIITFREKNNMYRRNNYSRIEYGTSLLSYCKVDGPIVCDWDAKEARVTVGDQVMIKSITRSIELDPYFSSGLRFIILECMSFRITMSLIRTSDILTTAKRPFPRFIQFVLSTSPICSFLQGLSLFWITALHSEFDINYISFIHPYAYLFVGLFTFLEMLIDLLHDAFDARIKFIYTPKFYVKTAFFLAFSFCYPQVVLNWMQFFKVKRCHSYVRLFDGMLEWTCAISATVYHFINSKTPMHMYITPTVEDVRNISSFPKEVYLPYFQSEVIYESLSDKK